MVRTDLDLEDERLAVLEHLRAQRETLVEQIDEANKLLADFNRWIAEYEQTCVPTPASPVPMRRRIPPPRSWPVM